MTDAQQPTIPDPIAGQTWRSPRARVKPRVVMTVERWKYRTAVVVDGIGAISLGRFHAWARRSGARP